MKNLFTKYRLELIKEDIGEYDINTKINEVHDAYKILNEIAQINKEPEEVLYLIVLNATSDVLGLFEVSRGTVSKALVSPREIFKRIFLLNGSTFILAHNHPMTLCTPSANDYSVTDKLKNAANIFDITFYDHIITGENSYYSFKNNKLL